MQLLYLRRAESVRVLLRVKLRMVQNLISEIVLLAMYRTAPETFRGHPRVTYPTQLPMPDMFAWSKRSAFTGTCLLLIFRSSHSSVRMCWSITGSRPFSFSGVVFLISSAAQSTSRTRENLRASVKAASTFGSSFVSSQNFQNLGGQTSSSSDSLGR